MSSPNDNFLDVSLDDLTDMHPKGSFQFVLKEITPFVAEYRNNQKEGKPIEQGEFLVFSLVTKDDDGIHRVIDTKKMTVKINSPKASLFILLSGWFGGIKVDEVKAKVPSMRTLLGRNGMANINHDASAQGTVYATIGSLNPIMLVKGKPVLDDIVLPDSFHYEPLSSRRKMQPNPSNPRFPWFLARHDDESADADTADVKPENGQQEPVQRSQGASVAGKAKDAKF